TSAADPAVEPKSIDPALRNCSALEELLVCTQRIVVPSRANCFSRKPFSLSSMETGLYVAQSMRISLGVSAAAISGVQATADSSVVAKNTRREMVIGSSQVHAFWLPLGSRTGRQGGDKHLPARSRQAPRFSGICSAPRKLLA